MSSCRGSAVAMVAVVLAPQIVSGQFDMPMFQTKVPQAESRQELDKFLDVVQVSEVEALPIMAANFRERFPDSAFIPQTFRMEMKAYRELQKFSKAINAGEEALQRNPDDVDTLLTLANMIPHDANGADGSDHALDKAESYAQQAIKLISSLKADRSVPLRSWKTFMATMEASAHSAFGLIALKRGSYSKSIAEFEVCTRLNPVADGTDYYLLGRAYRLQGDRARAKIALRQASEIGPEAVKAQAEAELALIGRN
jgi:tetratricopeptide (TPR) repeat protein